jgi:hypothetical protein
MHSTGPMIVRLKARSASPNTVYNFSLDNCAHEYQLFDKYWEQYHPQKAKRPFEHQPSETRLGSWQIAIEDQCLDQCIVRAALLTTANGNMAKASGESSFKLATMETYSRVLAELNLALEAVDKRRSESVLAACKLLATFEVRTTPIIGPALLTDNSSGFRSKYSFRMPIIKGKCSIHR